MLRLTLLKAACAAIIFGFSLSSLAAETPKVQIPQNEQTPGITAQSAQLVQVDINTADAATIAATLDGIGMVKAEEIVAYRSMFGNFSSIDELLEVQGIGAVTLDKNRSRILIGKN
jgi:competence protein ComEA